jgi:hypothetical protein
VGFLGLICEILAGALYSSYVLLGTWLAMVAVFVSVLLIRRRQLLRSGRRALLATEDVFGDLSRLERASPCELIVRRAHRLEVWSFVLPAVSLTLLLPLTLHLAVGTTFLSMPLAQFNAWILISLLLVGHAHLTLIILSVVHVLRVRSELDRGATVGGVRHGFWALLWTVTASTIPGALLLCVPPILVALTGLLFIPWMFHWISRRAEGERLLLEEHGLMPPFLADARPDAGG